MKIPFFFSLFIIFIVFFNMKLRKVSKEIENSKKKFLERERESMFVRKKSLEDLDYISVSLDDLPMLKEEELSSDAEKQAYRHQKTALDLASKPLLNLSGKSNTDLKFQYGPANLETLMNYEQNYENLLKSLLNWGRYLKKANRTEDAIAVLEKAVSIGTDLSQNYILLSDLYHETNQKDKLLNLKELVENQQGQNTMLKKVLQHIEHILNM
ncbi:hypothetical protein [Defluviitalea saccharophila]|uniref:Tetratricopeptide repeat protein n=1 Tax=Defluviitalea saccharophila TaxID=879970 RepID=A0ABZ2Y4E1_9FIRM|nr:hypothetical protein [Candidatus Epulonipiscium sp.]